MDLSPDQRIDARHREVDAWAASGAMALTARRDGRPLGPPSGLVPKLHAVAKVLNDRAARLGGAIEVDPLALLGERAATAALPRGGTTSCGGSTRLLRAGSRWLAVTLARPEDEELVPAWFELDGRPDDGWAAVAACVARRPLEGVVERALLLGLPVGLLAERAAATLASGDPLPLHRTPVAGSIRAASRLAEIVVIDLSSLWAGPLCGSLLAEAGATVIKVESATRPDGARQGPSALFDLLNAGKQSVALDLRSTEGVHRLRELVAGADVVIEASRPRALEQLGLEAIALSASGRPRVWASITGHGRAGAGRNRVAFGDDAAVAGALVGWADARPIFCGDAIADPITGLVAAAGILAALTSGGRWLLDIPLAGVASHLAGPPIPLTGWHGPVSPPRARPASRPGPRLGEHTTSVLDALPSLV